MTDASPGPIKYRPDIDGLRAIAVILVVACHFNFRAFRGGFIGVDVFFVISGYLISAIILSQVQASSFSLVSFYERRIRRIFPALFGVLLVTSIAAYHYFLPSELEDYASSAVAAVFSVANLYFWRQSGYFDAPAATKPLLHTWSLGVEEQFYILFPLILLLVRRLFPTRLRTAIVTIAVVSLAISSIGAFKAPISTFYLAHTRAWELLLGTILSMRLLPELSNRPVREMLALLGIALIAIPARIYSPTTPFPGLTALPPCLGAALIISAGSAGDSIVKRILSSKPFVFVGLISYSLYLWHWPIAVFQSTAGILYGATLGRLPKVAGLAVSFVLAYLSWRFIETPFRNGRLRLQGPALFRWSLAGATVITLFAAVVLSTRGFESRLTPEAARVASYLHYKSPYREGVCFITSEESYEDFNKNTCLREDPTRSNYLLIGDSHGAQLWYGLSTVLDGVNVMQATASGCKPVVHTSGDGRCTQLIQYMYSQFIPTHHVDKLLLAARWQEVDLPQVTETIAWAKSRGIKVVLFGPIVQYDMALPRLLVHSIVENDPSFPYHHRLSYYTRLDREMKAYASSKWNVEYVSYFDTLCQRDSCVEYAQNGVPLQSDTSHLTKEGSVLVAEKLSASRYLP